MIPYGRQSINDDDIAAVVDALRSDWLTTGPRVVEFEAAVAARVGARHAVAFANGTAALHGAALAAGLGPGDLLVTSPLTFVASANCALFVGADVVLADISPDTLLLDPASVPDQCDAIVAVHYAGLPFDLRELRTRPRVVIEDASHALGAMTPDGPVGNCAWSDMCTFSFHPVKHATTGEGGVVTTNSDELAERLRRVRSHATVPWPEEGGWAYLVASLGYNFRLTDLQAALGVSQLRKLDGFLERRRVLAARYRALLAHLPVTLPPSAPEGFQHAYHLFPVRVPHRRRVYEELRAAGVGVQVHYVPVHWHPLHAKAVPPAGLPQADLAYGGLLSLPLFPGLTDSQQDHVVAVLAKAVGT